MIKMFQKFKKVYLQKVLLFGVICFKIIIFVKIKKSQRGMLILFSIIVVCSQKIFSKINTLPQMLLCFKTWSQLKNIFHALAAFNCFYLNFRKKEFSGVKAPLPVIGVSTKLQMTTYQLGCPDYKLQTHPFATRAEVRFFKNGCNEGWKIFARNKAGGRERGGVMRVEVGWRMRNFWSVFSFSKLKK